jgi:hypothetical protein
MDTMSRKASGVSQEQIDDLMVTGDMGKLGLSGGGQQ